MGNCCNTSKTPVSVLQKDANVGTSSVNDNLLTEETRLGAMTGFFQTTGKKIPEGMQNNAENHSEPGSNNASHNFKENDGLEMTDVQ